MKIDEDSQPNIREFACNNNLLGQIQYKIIAVLHLKINLIEYFINLFTQEFNIIIIFKFIIYLFLFGFYVSFWMN